MSITNQNSQQPKRRANELAGQTWTRYSISVWSDLRKTPEETALHHPAIFPGSLVSRLMQAFMNDQDRVVLDPFAGIGSTVLAARNHGKQGIGIELSPSFASQAKQRLRQKTLFNEQQAGTATIIVDDAHNLRAHIDPETVDLVVTSPPYWDILSQKRTADYKEIRDYGDETTDLAKIHDYQEFLVQQRLL